MTTAATVKIGVIVPAGNTVHESEFARMRPENVTFRFTSFASVPAGVSSFCDGLAEAMAPPIAELKGWGAELILIGCTAASMKCSDDAYHQKLEALAGVPVVTAAAASRAAFSALGIHSVAITTPYSDGSNGVVSDFLQRAGLSVAAIKGLAFDKSPEMWRERAVTMTAQQMFDFSETVPVEAAQAMYFPCTGINTLDTLGMFERKHGKPALSSVQAGFWASLNRLGINGRKAGFGKLIEVWDF